MVEFQKQSASIPYSRHPRVYSLEGDCHIQAEDISVSDCSQEMGLGEPKGSVPDAWPRRESGAVDALMIDTTVYDNVAT
jgi:hypothetical protein